MIQIRQCCSEDLGHIMHLLHQLWPEKHLDGCSIELVFKRGLASEQQVYLCAADGDHIIGFGSLTLKNSLWQEGSLGHVDELVVDRQYRERGVGTQLLTELVDLARRKGCRRIELDSAFHRKEAHRFYERQG